MGGLGGVDPTGTARRAVGGRVDERAEHLGPRVEQRREQRVEGPDAAGAGGRRSVVDPCHQLRGPSGHRSRPPAPAHPPPSGSSPVTLATSRAFHATSALKPTEPIANAGLWRGAPLGDRSIEVTSSPFSVVPRRRGAPGGHRVVPAGTVVTTRLPRMAQLHQAAGAPASSAQEELHAALGAPHQLVVGRHPEPGELGDGVAVHGWLGDRRGIPPPPERRMGERTGAVAQVGHEPVVSLRRQRAAELLQGPLVTEVGPDDGMEAAVPQPLPGVGRRVRHAEAAGRVAPPRRLQHRAHSIGDRCDGR